MRKRKEVHIMKKKILALTLALTIPASAFAAFANSDETVNYDDLVVTLPATEADGGPVYDGDNTKLITTLPALEKDAVPVVDNEYDLVPISLKEDMLVTLDAAPSKIVLGDKELKGAPVLKDGVLMLPLREIVEADGMTLEWDEETNTAQINSGMFAVTLGENKYIKGRMKALKLECAPVLVDDKTYVPANYFAEVFDKNVEVKDSEVHIADMVIEDTTETPVDTPDAGTEAPEK